MNDTKIISARYCIGHETHGLESLILHNTYVTHVSLGSWDGRNICLHCIPPLFHPL